MLPAASSPRSPPVPSGGPRASRSQSSSNTRPAEENAEEEPEQASSVNIQENDQVNNQTNVQGNNNTIVQNNYYAQANNSATQEPAAEAPSENRIKEQPKFGIGIRGAFNYGMMYGFKEEDDEIDDNPAGIGFEGGLMGRIMLVSNLFFAPELNIAYISTEHKYISQKRTYESLDLEIPLLMRGVVLDLIYVTGGPQLNINLNNDYKFEGEEDNLKENIDEAKFTFGLAVGAGINVVEGLFIDIRFYMGLMDLYPDVDYIGDLGNAADSDSFSYINMKGAKMMKIKAGLSYWFI